LPTISTTGRPVPVSRAASVRPRIYRVWRLSRPLQHHQWRSMIRLHLLLNSCSLRLLPHSCSPLLIHLLPRPATRTPVSATEADRESVMELETTTATATVAAVVRADGQSMSAHRRDIQTDHPVVRVIQRTALLAALRNLRVIRECQAWRRPRRPSFSNDRRGADVTIVAERSCHFLRGI
jgi:hypothetical protein